MKVIVHYPSNQADESELAKRVAQVHAQYVLQYVESLPCSKEAKQSLLKALQSQPEASPT